MVCIMVCIIHCMYHGMCRCTHCIYCMAGEYVYCTADYLRPCCVMLSSLIFPSPSMPTQIHAQSALCPLYPLRFMPTQIRAHSAPSADTHARAQLHNPLCTTRNVCPPTMLVTH